MLRAYRFQLRCKPAQERALRRFAGGLRWLWNKALAEQQARYARGERFAGYSDMCKWLAGIELKRGYLKRGDSSRTLAHPWACCSIKTITHTHLGARQVHVFAITVN